MKKLIGALILLLISIMTFSLAACANQEVRVTFDLDGGTSSGELSITLKKGAELDFISIPNPTHPDESFKFGGWKYNDEVYRAPQTLAVNENIVLKAVWVVKEFSVTFMNGDVLLSTEAYAFGTMPAIPEFSESFPETIIVSDAVQKVFTGWDSDVVAVNGDAVYSAVYIEEARAYSVKFMNGDVLISTEECAFGTMPAIPEFSDSFPKTIIVSDAVQKVFTGWDNEVVAVKGDAVYTAVYADEQRVYTLRFTENAFITVKSEEGKAVTELQGEFNETLKFTVALNDGVVKSEFKVWVGDVEVTHKNGLYAVMLRGNAEVTVTGLTWVKHDTVINAKNATIEETGGANFGVQYNGSFEFKTKGAEGYGDFAPTVTYCGRVLTPISQDAGGMYLYRVGNIVSTETLTVEGVIDYIWIDYVQRDSSVIRQRWCTKTSEYIGREGSNKDYFFEHDGLYMDSIGVGDKTYDTVGSKISYNTYFVLTQSSALSDRVISQEAADGWQENPQRIVPEKGGNTTFYLVYVAVPRIYENKFVLPAGAKDIVVTLDGKVHPIRYPDQPGRPDVDGYVPTILVNKLPHGSALTLTYSIPEGDVYQTYRYGGVSVDAVGGVYTFTVTADALWLLETTYYTVTLPELETSEYALYNFGEDSFNGRTQKVPRGADFRFYFEFTKEYTDIERNYAAYTNSLRAGSYGIEFDPDQGWSKCSVKGYIRNVTSDIDLTYESPEEKPYGLLFTVYDSFTYEIDGAPVVPVKGEKTVRIVMMQSSSVLTLAPKAGYMFSKAPRWTFYYFNGETVDDKVINGVIGESGFNYEFRLNSFRDGALVEYDSETASAEQKVSTFKDAGVVPQFWKAVQYTDRFDAVQEGGVFQGTPAKTVTDGEDYTVSIKSPTGKTPQFFVEYENDKSRGFVAVPASGAEGGVYTFTVRGVPCGIRWYIELRASVYEVTFVWGENSKVLMLAHGTRISDIDLPTGYDGVDENGVAGRFRVTGWKDSVGGIISILGGGTITAVTEFTPAAAKFNDTYFQTVREAIASLNSSSEGNLDILTESEAQTLEAGEYMIPKGVVLRLPYAKNAYGYKLADYSDNPSILYVDAARGRIALTISADAVIHLFGKIEVGGIVGYPLSAHPYQGHTSAEHSVLQLDGKINVKGGGTVVCYGFITGAGEIDALSGATVESQFVVKDYRGGTNTTTVFFEEVAPFNVYEMANILTRTTYRYGAKEVAFAMLFASNEYQNTQIEILGSKGLIQPAEGGRIEKTAEKIVNPRYSAATAGYEPPYEYRIRLDVYGGGNDGVLSLLGMADTEEVTMAISYVYDIHLYGGEYTLKNGYKIMPGGKLTVEKGATLKITTIKGLLGTLTAYRKEFQDSFGSSAFDRKQLLYPKINVDGKLIVNGTLIVEGRFGADVLSEEAGARIEVYCVDTFLQVTQREGVGLPKADGTIPFELTYNEIVYATVNGDTKLVSGRVYRSVAENGKMLWK